MKHNVLWLVLGIWFASFAGLTSAQATQETCSPSSDVAAELRIINNLDTPVDLIWIDFECGEQYYGTVEPGQTLAQGSFAAHIWLLRTPDGVVIDQFALEAGLTEIELSADMMAPPDAAVEATPVAETVTIDFGLGPNYVACRGNISSSSIVSSVDTAGVEFLTLHDGCETNTDTPLTVNLNQYIDPATAIAEVVSDRPDVTIEYYDAATGALVGTYNGNDGSYMAAAGGSANQIVVRTSSTLDQRGILRNLTLQVADAAAYTLEAPILGTGEVQVTLDWDTQADVDLSVTEPSGETISYMQTQSSTGGFLDVDSNNPCSTNPSGVENIFWADDTAPSGSYTASISVYDLCGGAEPNWTLNVRVRGEVILTQSGTGNAEFTFEVGEAAATDAVEPAPSADATAVPPRPVTLDFGIGPNYGNCVAYLTRSAFVTTVDTAGTEFKTLFNGCELNPRVPMTVNLAQSIVPEASVARVLADRPDVIIDFIDGTSGALAGTYTGQDNTYTPVQGGTADRLIVRPGTSGRGVLISLIVQPVE